MRAQIDSLKSKCSNLEKANIDIKEKYEELSAKVNNSNGKKIDSSTSTKYSNLFKSLSTPREKRPSTAAEDSNNEVNETEEEEEDENEED